MINVFLTQYDGAILGPIAKLLGFILQGIIDLVEYDKEITRYNQTRSGSTSDNDWCDHILGYYREALNYHILDYLRGQGFEPRK